MMTRVVFLAVILGHLALVQAAVAQEPAVTPASGAWRALGTTPADGPISRAAAIETARLAATESLTAGVPAVRQEDTRPEDEWSRVQRLNPGTSLTVVLNNGERVRGRLVFCDAAALITRNPDGPRLPARVEQALFGMDSAWSTILAGGGTSSGQVRVTREGIFDGDVRVADLTQVIHQTTRDEISEIWGPARKRGSAVGAVAGAGAGLLVGFVAAMGLAYKDCGDSCGDEKLMAGLSIIGLPIAGALLGYRAGNHTVTDLIYRSPSPRQQPRPVTPWPDHLSTR
jgi:hypothetical protein